MKSMIGLRLLIGKPSPRDDPESIKAYSVTGEIGCGWWLVEHYSAYHVDCPDGCGLGEPTRGR